MVLGCNCSSRLELEHADLQLQTHYYKCTPCGHLSARGMSVAQQPSGCLPVHSTSNLNAQGRHQFPCMPCCSPGMHSYNMPSNRRAPTCPRQCAVISMSMDKQYCTHPAKQARHICWLRSKGVLCCNKQIPSERQLVPTTLVPCSRAALCRVLLRERLCTLMHVIKAISSSMNLYKQCNFTLHHVHRAVAQVLPVSTLRRARMTRADLCSR